MAKRKKSPTKKDGTKVSGVVSRIFWENGKFTIGQVVSDTGNKIGFKGAVIVEQGQSLDLIGSYVDDPKYGKTFVAKSVTFHTSLSSIGLANYISKHPDMKFIGEVRAAKLVAHCGERFGEMIIDQPDELAKIAGVKVDVINRLAHSWQQSGAVNQALVYLSEFGLTHLQVKNIVKKFGNDAVTLFKKNPYMLIGEVKGWAFRKVDVMALKYGIDKKDDNRLAAGTIQAVVDALDKGHCWTELEEAITDSQKLLNLDDLNAREVIDKFIDRLISEGKLYAESNSGRFLIALPSIYEREMEIGKFLAQGFGLSEHEFTGTIPQEKINDVIEGLPDDNIFKQPGVLSEVLYPRKEIAEAITKHAPTLNEKQIAAVTKALTQRISLITGGAGVGKSFTAAAVINIYLAANKNVVMAAPTGKAAKRLEELSGLPGFTIHRLLGYSGHAFQVDSSNPIEADLLIIDEFSMVDINLAWHLFDAIDLEKTSVVFLGDHNQLPPIGAGNILRDMVNRSLLPVTILDEVVRQAGILKSNSVAILKGVVPLTPDKITPDEILTWYNFNQYREASDIIPALLAMIETTIPNKLNFDPIKEVQILSPTRKGGLGVEQLNIALQRKIQKHFYGVEVNPQPAKSKAQPYKHDKVIQRRNNYDLDVMNGTVGTVLDTKETIAKKGFWRGHRFVTGARIDFDGKIVTVNREQLLEIDLAYCLTIHQSQGSEFPCAIVIIHRSHQYQHNRNLIYTGVTRAKKTAIIIGDAYGIRECAKRTSSGERRTFLSLLTEKDLV